ncbi:ankyrin repeat-containing domain protein [Hypoxylon trugodes]|uniref:ankyrin repeat-containing domain protein n=1 Tax=Hypoxylon trugodes TaxID=326681 RepID=UPI0021960988|nr:ankyrin repeat-containing domain protein [Hypoxylon trugodes]KAI1384899.1 ankyrin repeat-containing domain protein [Hypoxylon trugodes]
MCRKVRDSLKTKYLPSRYDPIVAAELDIRVTRPHKPLSQTSISSVDEASVAEAPLDSNTLDPNHFGTYIFENWAGHCKSFCGDGRFTQRIYQFIQGARSTLEAWIFEVRAVCLAVTRLIYQSEEVACIDPLLCVASFNFPFFHHDVSHRLALSLDLGDTTAQNLRGWTVFHIACRLSNSLTVEGLLQFERANQRPCRSLLFVEDYGGSIPLQYSSRNKIVKILLEYEMLESHRPADRSLRISELMEHRDKFGHTPLETIIEKCSDEYIEQLLTEYRLGPNQSRYEIVRHATCYQKRKAIRCLLRADTDAEKSSEELPCSPPLYVAIQQGDLEMVDLFLHWKRGTKGIPKSILDHEGTPVSIAATTGSTSVVQYLLDHGEEINGIGGPCGTALGMAVCENNMQMVEFLLARGADVNARGSDHEAPLGVAAYRGNGKMARFLLIMVRI